MGRMSSEYPADRQQRSQHRSEHGQEERKGKYDEYPDGNRQADQRAGNCGGLLVRWRNQGGQYRCKQRRERAAHRCNDDLRNRIPRNHAQRVGEPQRVTKKVGHPQQEHAEKDRGVDAADGQRNDEEPTYQPHERSNVEDQGRDACGVSTGARGWASEDSLLLSIFRLNTA